MGTLASSFIFPHPPIIVPEVGRGGETDAVATIQSARRAAAEIKEINPTTIIITTPHGPAFSDYIYIPLDKRLEGGLGRFGAGNVKLDYDNNIALAEAIIGEAREADISAGDIQETILKKFKISKELDHGVTVPLYFVSRELKKFKLVYISTAFMPFEDLYRFGMCVQKAVEESEEKVVIIASGDLSHRLSAESPNGYNPKGREFDDLFVKSIRNVDVETLLNLDEDFCDNAGECGLRSFLIMFGALDGYKLSSEVFSYEGPFGVGYSVARIDPGKKTKTGDLLKNIEASRSRKLKEIRKKEDEYAKLARESLETYIKKGTVIETPRDLQPVLLQEKAGAFVSIKKNGQLRGCIGTISPVRKNIAEEIINNAISSGTDDPRFEPVEADELDQLVYSVDVLGEPEPISSTAELDVIRYGVIVKSGRRSGLLLPNLEGVDTPEQQVSIALQKAGIRNDENYDMERFEVVRHA